MRELVGLSLVVGLLLAGCAPVVVSSKGHVGGRERMPVWVDTVGAACGTSDDERAPDLTAECGIGEALYVEP